CAGSGGGGGWGGAGGGGGGGVGASGAGTGVERQGADDALRESQLRYSTLAETVPEVLYTNNPDGACDYVSQRFLDYTGLTSGAALGFGWSEAIHPVDRDRTVALWDESARSGAPFHPYTPT